jgi:TatD DNase family protein
LRGKTCEPAYIVHTARCLAELRGQTFDAIARDTSANAAKRLALSLPAD